MTSVQQEDPSTKGLALSVEEITNSIMYLIDEASNLTFFGQSLIAEMHLKPGTREEKETICTMLNLLFQCLQKSGVQIIGSVINDDNNRYARIINQETNGTEINADLLVQNQSTDNSDNNSPDNPVNDQEVTDVATKH